MSELQYVSFEDFSNAMPSSKPAKKSQRMSAAEMAQALKRIQDSDHYVDEILDLRKKKVLHDLFEYRAAILAKETRYAQFIHVQKEKYGISNGRIDLSIYRPGAANVHIEFIASCGNGHVFRDTTSLLASSADARLAVLVDEDVDANVAKHFFKAIPNGQIRHVYLRHMFLDGHSRYAQGIIEGLVAEAEFITGVSAPDGFGCELERQNITPGEPFSIVLRNCSLDEVARAQIRSDFGLVQVWAGDLVDDVQSIMFNIPKSPILRRGRCRLEVVLDSGPVISHVAYIDKDIKPMGVRSDRKLYNIGEDVKLELRDFPSNHEFQVYLWQGNSGEGVAKGITDQQGEAHVRFALDPFTGSGVLVQGKHKITVRADGYPAPAFCFVDVGVENFRISEIPLIAKGRMSGIESRACSLNIANVNIQAYRVVLDLHIMALIAELHVTGIRATVYVEKWSAAAADAGQRFLMGLSAHQFHLRWPQNTRGLPLPLHGKKELIKVCLEPVRGKYGSTESKDFVSELLGDERIFMRVDFGFSVGYHSMTLDMLLPLTLDQVRLLSGVQVTIG